MIFRMKIIHEEKRERKSGWVFSRSCLVVASEKNDRCVRGDPRPLLGQLRPDGPQKMVIRGVGTARVGRASGMV